MGLPWICGGYFGHAVGLPWTCGGYFGHVVTFDPSNVAPFYGKICGTHKSQFEI